MKKIIVLILCAVMCVPLFVGCGGDDPEVTSSNTGNATTDPVTTDTSEIHDDYDNVVKKNWDGYVFKMHYMSGADRVEADFVCESPNGNVLNDQVHQRNTMIEKDLGITLEVHTDGSYASLLQSQYTADWVEGDYNMFVNSGIGILGQTRNGYAADLASYDEVDLYKDYWDQGFVEQLMIDDSLYAITGEFSVCIQTAVQVLCFNKNLFRENGLEEPYSLVKTNEWTVDKLLEYMDGFAKDYDNDGYDWDKDRFNISGWGYESAYGVFYGLGFTFAENDGETLTLDFDRDLLDDVLDATLEVWANNGSYILSGKADQYHMPHDIFSEGRGLFCDIQCFKISRFFGEMDDDYGILPEPMLNKEQGRYYSYVAANATAMCIPVRDPNPERTGNIIESITAASSDVVIPKMFEIVTKIQNARDEESADMLDIAIKNKIFDAAHWLQLHGICSLSASIISEKQNVSSSYLGAYMSTAESELEAYIEMVERIKA